MCIADIGDYRFDIAKENGVYKAININDNDILKKLKQKKL